MKRKLLIFHPALAPYRVDQFNRLSLCFDVTIVFLFANVWNHSFNQDVLTSKLNCKYKYLLDGPCINGRVLRFGMLKVIKDVNPDVILGYEFSFTTILLIIAKKLRLFKAELGSTIDDSIGICTRIQSLPRRFARYLAVSQLDYLIVLSNVVSEYYSNSFHIDDRKIVTSPLLQDSSRLRGNQNGLENIASDYVQKWQLKGKTVLLFVGRFIAEKGLIQFIKTIAPDLRLRAEVCIVLVGDGSERRELEILIDSESLHKQVILPGRFEDIELHSWYLCASGFLLPSIFEPFGAVVDEALIFGLPVLCSNIAGSAELVVNTGGILFDPFNKIQTVNAFLIS